MHCVANCYLIQAAIITNPDTTPSYAKIDGMNSEDSFCADMGLVGVDMFVSNRFDFGHLL